MLALSRTAGRAAYFLIFHFAGGFYDLLSSKDAYRIKKAKERGGPRRKGHLRLALPSGKRKVCGVAGWGLELGTEAN